MNISDNNMAGWEKKTSAEIEIEIEVDEEENTSQWVSILKKKRAQRECFWKVVTGP